jgi:hypothetical protein
LKEFERKYRYVMLTGVRGVIFQNVFWSDCGSRLVPVGTLPGVPNDQRNRLAHARRSRRRRGDEPRSRAVMSIVPAKRAIR